MLKFGLPGMGRRGAWPSYEVQRSGLGRVLVDKGTGDPPLSALIGNQRNHFGGYPSRTLDGVKRSDDAGPVYVTGKQVAESAHRPDRAAIVFEVDSGNVVSEKFDPMFLIHRRQPDESWS